VLEDGFVVVPAYNEAEVILGVVEALGRHFGNVVVVDDGSTDGTSELLRTHRVKVVTHAVNLGQGAALQTGITYALLRGAEWIVTFDADGQHRVDDAIAMVQLLRTGACDVVLGSRFLQSNGAINMPWSRAIVLKCAVWVSNLLSRKRFTDAHNGLRALSRKAAQRLSISQNGMAHASEIISQLSKSGLVIREIPVSVQYTDYSLRKGQSIFNALNIVIDLQVERFRR
jgi:glycosyltransferase involved in cell wall biosynthesis